MPVFRRSQMGVNSGSAGAQVPESEAWLAFPNLIDFLSTQSWPDGLSRATGTLLLFRETGLWKCCLRDRDAGQTTFVSAPTIDELFKRCDELVATGGGEWRAERPQGKKR